MLQKSMIPNTCKNQNPLLARLVIKTYHKITAYMKIKMQSRAYTYRHPRWLYCVLMYKYDRYGTYTSICSN